MIVLHEFWKKHDNYGDSRITGSRSFDMPWWRIIATISGAVALGLIVGLPIALQLHLLVIQLTR